MTPVTVGNSSFSCVFSTHDLAPECASVLNADIGLTVETGAARLSSYVTTAQLRSLAHMLTCHADKIDCARYQQEQIDTAQSEMTYTANVETYSV